MQRKFDDIPANISSSVGPSASYCGIPAKPAPLASVWSSAFSGLMVMSGVSSRGLLASMVCALGG